MELHQSREPTVMRGFFLNSFPLPSPAFKVKKGFDELQVKVGWVKTEGTSTFLGIAIRYHRYHLQLFWETFWMFMKVLGLDSQ